MDDWKFAVCVPVTASLGVMYSTRNMSLLVLSVFVSLPSVGRSHHRIPAEGCSVGEPLECNDLLRIGGSEHEGQAVHELRAH